MPERKVAFITGASRGIGRGCALELARRAFDVVLTARTVTGQERLEHSSTVRKSLTDPLPGSLEQTAREVRALGVDALVAKLDLSRREDWPAAIDAALGRFARIDVLVNNGRYVGPGHMDPFEETPIELIEQMMLCNVIAPLHLIKLCLPAMKRQGGGIVINITSSGADRQGRLGPRLLAHEGGLQPYGPRAREGAPTVPRRGHRPDARLRRHRTHGDRAR